MRVRLRPGLRVLWRSATTIQIGWGSYAHLIYENPTSSDLKVLQSLQYQGATHDHTNPLLRRLYEENLLLPKSQVPLPNIEHGARSRLAADSFVRAITAGQEHGWHDVSKRAAARVSVQGLGRMGAQLVRLLAHCVVGELVIWDDGAVTHRDVLPGGFSTEQVGSRRDWALQKMITSQHEDVTIRVQQEYQADLAVLIGAYVIDPLHYEELLREDRAHLALMLNDFGMSVGPLTVPGSSPCLRCIDLHRVDADPAWPVLATQLCDLSGDQRPQEDSALSALGTAISTNVILDSITSPSPKPLSSTIEFTVEDFVPAVREWSMHPRCGCASSPAT